MSFITCDDAAFSYEGRVVLEKLHFAIEQGNYVCIVGENGTGKSTLLKGLLRLKAPIRGALNFAFKPCAAGYLPQHTTEQRDNPASVLEILLSGRLGRLGARPFYSKRDKADALDMMEQLEITALMKESYRTLSGGQQQRVLLARALLAAESFLALDEPVSGLDPLVTSELYDIIQRINAQKGITVAMVSHDLQSALAHASHILHLKQTQLFFGPVAEYLLTDAAEHLMGGNVHVDI